MDCYVGILFALVHLLIPYLRKMMSAKEGCLRRLMSTHLPSEQLLSCGNLLSFGKFIILQTHQQEICVG